MDKRGEPHVSAHAEETLSVLRCHLPVLQRRYAVRSLGVFGSTVRGEARKDSDLDLLVTFDTAPSLFRDMCEASQKAEQYTANINFTPSIFLNEKQTIITRPDFHTT